MITKFSKEDLIRFENRVADAFNDSKIKAPVHLYSGNEKQMLKIFENIAVEDWVLCSWRSHYQCLLKGVPEEDLFQAILEGRSISLCFPEQRIFCSGIVGGSLPIATGIALSIKLNSGKNHVHCFVGDMTAETGIFHECLKYSRNHDLPIRFIIEDNGVSVCTDTRATWCTDKLTYEYTDDPMLVYYRYENTYPHAGAGIRVQF
jgi:pyruvate dehydrogenase E1 component alpha subunit|tara:strand:- start:1369 stop:1980 length:612 start_codon:yes stop_codon:yes gene_type:complete